MIFGRETLDMQKIYYVINYVLIGMLFLLHQAV